jgi:phosphoribosylglycinamide formyltransferase-1
MRIAVLVSGGGTNLQALIDAQEQAASAHGTSAGTRAASVSPVSPVSPVSSVSSVSPVSSVSRFSRPSRGLYEIALVIADRNDTYAIERARKAGIPAVLALPPQGVSREEARLAVSNRVLELAKEYRCDALVLAGFLTILSGPVIDAYANRIVNLHPALLPKFGGKGMWGHHVHEAVLAAGETESGCTIHLVDSGCDTGPILLQKKVPVLPGDSAETLAARISEQEHEAIVEGVSTLARRLAGLST